LDRGNDVPQPEPALPPADASSAALPAEAVRDPIVVRTESRNLGGKTFWYATIEGDTFQIGRDVGFDKGRLRGLMTVREDGYTQYDPDNWREEFGVWADILAATAWVESECDLCTVNTYDDARFTFGMMQWAAHTANANFVVLFQRLLARPEASYYFPDLCLVNARIAQRSGNGVVALESADSTSLLQNFLNPDPREVGEGEVTIAAKLMHWIRTEPDVQALVIRFALEAHQNLLRDEVDPKVGLDGRTDVEVLLCLDIRHQGRGSYDLMKRALKDPERSVAELLKIGVPADPSKDRFGAITRTKELKKRILDGIGSARLGRRRYDRASGQMVRTPDAPTVEEDAVIKDAVLEDISSVEASAPSQAASPAQSGSDAALSAEVWPEAHLWRNPAPPSLRDYAENCAYRLAEPNMPARDINASAEEKARALHGIAIWLKPETSARYQPKDGKTRCNIYAHDFALLAGAYLPRVWWKKTVLNRAPGDPWPQPITGKWIEEYTANALRGWFGSYSAHFGWRRVETPDQLQNHANAGGVSIIIARSRDPDRSGHINLVIPERPAVEGGDKLVAIREGDAVKIPLQSQAGQYNFTFGFKPDRATGKTPECWWCNSDHQDFGFWIHD
jgi:hypothetical protein